MKSQKFDVFSKIFHQKLKMYLKDTINLFNTKEYPDFLRSSKNLILLDPVNKGMHPYYLKLFFNFLKGNNTIPEDKQLPENFLDEIDSCLLNNYLSAKKFIDYYGGVSPDLVTKLDSKLNSIIMIHSERFLMEFLRLSETLMILNAQTNWEDHSIKIIMANKDHFFSIKNFNTRMFRLFEHLHQHNPSLTEDVLNYARTKITTYDDNRPLTTQSQMSFASTLDEMGIRYRKEYSRDNYVYDFYLDDYNIVLEYDGPIHFYPLQTQLRETDKFRIRNIMRKYGSKVIKIPFFESSKFDDKKNAYLEMTIKNPVDLFNSPLFEVNFDMMKRLRKLEN